MEIIAYNIKKAREKNKISIRELARKIGVSASLISSIEKQLPLLKAHYSYFQLHDQNSSYFLTS